MNVSPTVCGFRKPSYGDSIFAGGKQVPRQKKLTSIIRIELKIFYRKVLECILSDIAKLAKREFTVTQ